MAQLTEKELMAINDQLGEEKLLVSKFRSYASITQDPQIREKCEQLAGKHQTHYDKLFSFLG